MISGGISIMSVDCKKINYNNAFLAYGVFKPKQVAYSLIKDYVSHYSEEIYLMDYQLLHRNGMPMIVENTGFNTYCNLITFNRDNNKKAYETISKPRSNSLFKWDEIEINSQTVNCLVAKNQNMGEPYVYEKYDGKNDIGFYETLNFIKSNLDKQRNDNHDQNNFLLLQMNYMLLWSVIDKYTALRYGGWGQMTRVEKLSKETAFRNAIQNHVQDRSAYVYSSSSNNKYDLDVTRRSNNGYENIAKYYYHIRCNIVHGGKVMFQESEPVKLATEELLNVMRYILDDAFNMD